jgi:spore maturation protein CgeB
MKIYYIASGYRRPIDMLDNAIMKALGRMNIQAAMFPLNRRPLPFLLPEIRQFAPELVLTICGPRSHLPIELVRSIRNMGIETAVWFVDDPYAIDNSLKIAREYDTVFTIDSGCVPFYMRAGCKRVYHLPLGTDPEIFHPFAVHPSYDSDVCFVGTGYENRLRFMEEMLKFLNGNIRVQLVGHFWEVMKLSVGCMPNIRKKWVNSPETARYYNGARIVLNIHRSHDDPLLDKNKSGAPGHSINNRTFDIAACRAFQLIDYRPDLELFYAPGEEMNVFDSPRECAEQIHRYLYDAEIRDQIAGKAFNRTRENHTFTQRLETLIAQISEEPRQIHTEQTPSI